MINTIQDNWINKLDLPFSLKLNNFIRNWYKSHEHLFTFSSKDKFCEFKTQSEAFKYMCDNYRKTGKIEVWNGASNNTIYGDNRVNIMMRCWHDYTHINNNLDFSGVGESLVAVIQKNELPQKWTYEKRLIEADILGQTQFYWLNNQKFVEKQRQFVNDYLLNPIKAMHSNYDIKRGKK